MKFPKLLLSCTLTVCSIIFAAHPAFSSDDPIVWKPITPAELQMTVPKVEADADAEAIFWEVTVDDKKYGKLSYSHYVRIKIFTVRGRERFSKMDIPFTKNRKIEGVAARVIRPDGSVVELKPEDIFEREIVRAGKEKVQAKSFAVPGIEPGVIVEYQYSETIKNDSAGGERLVFQRDIPMQRVTYYVRPYGKMSLAFRSYNMDDLHFAEDKKGFSVGTMTDVPAFKDEPYMPPDDESRKFVFLTYQTLGSIFQWFTVSMTWQEVLKKFAKPNSEIKQKAAELTAGITSDDEKLRKIYEFTQKNIKNVTYDRTLTDEQRENLKVNDADDALRRGMGNSMFVDLLFASLAKAAGYEVSLVRAGDRGENFFSPDKYPFQNFIHQAAVGVQVGREWKYFNPGTPYLGPGQLVWNEENVTAMVIGNGGFTWKTTPLSTPQQSPARRTGVFKLLPDGTLEGTGTLEYEGHQAITRRRVDYRSSAAKREETIKNEVVGRMSSAEVTDISVENFDDPMKPLRYVYKVRVPNYALKAGKRLIVQPGFFEYGVSPVFSSATRTHNIFFRYPWSEQDKIEIQLPAGYAIESPEIPGDVFDPSGICRLNISMQIDKQANKLIYGRTFHFGANGKTLFPVSVYKALKGLFDAFHKADNTALSLKQTS
ncbi:MAG: DUF3857 and transglutaminase domain-containing protein [Acidobacteriota bacterium]